MGSEPSSLSETLAHVIPALERASGLKADDFRKLANGDLTGDEAAALWMARAILEFPAELFTPADIAPLLFEHPDCRCSHCNAVRAFKVKHADKFPTVAGQSEKPKAPTQQYRPVRPVSSEDGPWEQPNHTNDL